MRLSHYLIICLGILFSTCKPGVKQQEKSGMVALLEQTARESFYVPANIYASKTRIAHFDSLYKVSSPLERNKFRFLQAESCLFGGKTEQSIQILEELLQIRDKNRFVEGLEPHQEEQLTTLLALSYLRLGEQQNCITNHTSASCIIPIAPAGFHQLPEGSRKATELYQKILENNSHDYSSRWLLNVAYMTLGEYPTKVPERWLIPPKAFASEYPLQSFQEIAPNLGLDDNRLAGGSVVDDFNGDHYLDILITSWAASHQMRLFINNRNGTFSEKTKEAGLTGITGGLNMVQADYNNDGFTDVFVLRGAWLETLGKHPNSLLRNNGNGTFTDVTEEAGILSFHPTQTGVWQDFNKDGWVDLFIGNESSGEDNIHPCELFLNNRDGTFTEVAKRAGVQVSTDGELYYVKGVTAGDYDNDGWPDLYLSALDDRNPNILFKNTGLSRDSIPQFVNVSQAAGLGENISSFPTWFWDYDNDGWLDLFVAGFQRSVFWESITKDVAAEYLGLPFGAETARLYHNNADGTFSDVSEQVGLKKITYAMGANFGDFDNDGFLDMYLATGEVNFASIIPNKAFRNQNGTKFQDVTTAGGFGHLQKGHAVSFADLDNDGDQDIYAVMGGAYEGDIFRNALFENPYQNTNNWITIQLKGTTSNAAGIGGRIKLTLQNNGKTRTIHRDLNSGGSFGCSPLRAQIGLGTADTIRKIEVTWPSSKTTQVLENIAANQFIVIEEKKKGFKQLNLQAFKFATSAGFLLHNPIPIDWFHFIHPKFCIIRT
ncbi:CRTAC1 family protein [Rhodocytophaga rosea]|uniref:CRTAC1 family protein n=1 Tax=Rhodocytophaga rosea TaxID=2704465 RepID=A0A6C0GNR1_9BACT|nr:CRTAC1 family protein [Rhodocytophaga rosea]QHT69691.1 CRTAC1 family protein [Rhodocytophaga rosea]